MNPEAQFRVVMRGYEPAQVDHALADKEERVRAAEEAAQQLAAQLEQAQAQAQAQAAEAAKAVQALRAAQQEQAAPEPPTFLHLGEKVGQILALAEAEAAEMRDRAVAGAEDSRKEIERAAIDLRDGADRYSEQKRRDADAEAGRILADARKAADEERDAAERDSSARRQEAEAVYEAQRANAARAAAEFETTLAERRDRSTAEFQEQQAATVAQLEEMALQVEETRARIEREQASAEKEARRTVSSANEQAEAILRDARATAERIRIDSERELTAATQRRDSINAQLVNVRQMLATLSGSTSGLVDLPVDQPAAQETKD
jgi:hypothetical protein